MNHLIFIWHFLACCFFYSAHLNRANTEHFKFRSVFNKADRSFEVVQQEEFDTYCNARYNYCIDYPRSLMTPQPESANGDGRIFTDKKGKEVLRVFGRMIISEDMNLEKQYNDDVLEIEKGGIQKRKAGITYKKLGKTFFVLSGYKNGKIFYQKTILKEGAFAYAQLLYEPKDTVIYNKIAQRIFTSFK